MRVLGIDPSLNSTGIVLVDFSKRTPFLVAHELVIPGTKGSMASRLHHIYRAVNRFCEGLPAVDIIGVEDGIVHRSRKVSRYLAQARGAILASVYQQGGRSIYDITPFAVKEAAAGHRCASKEDVAKGIMDKVLFPPPPPAGFVDDITDAVAVAWAARQVHLAPQAGKRPQARR